jgi:hypothetical protein
VSYDYKTVKPRLFTEEGVAMFINIRDHVRELVQTSGAFTMGAAIRRATGDSWTMLACVDRLVEVGEVMEAGAFQRGQDRVFVPGPKWPKGKE